MLTIHLQNVKMFGYHGVYEHEKKNGNHFELNLIAHYLPERGVVENIDDVVDYSKVYEMVKQRMLMATPLLETLVIDIAQLILEKYKPIQHVFVSIAKLNPPIPDYQGNVVVSFELGREQ